MKMLNDLDAADWGRRRGVDLKTRESAKHEGFFVSRFEVPLSASRQLWFSRFVEQFLRPWSRCILWVTETGVWQSSENWHLYYKMRETYGDRQLIEDASAHLFLEYEADDLISFVQIGLGMGWNFKLLIQDGCRRVAVSHDEWAEFATRDKRERDELAKNALETGLKDVKPGMLGYFEGLTED